MTPLHVHSARTPAAYRQQQAQYIAQGRRRYPALRWRDPWVVVLNPAVVVEGGKWLVPCACGNYPSVHPDWQLACCFECGAVYEGLVLPAEASAIEQALLERPHPALRAWRPGETAGDLRAQTLRMREAS